MNNSDDELTISGVRKQMIQYGGRGGSSRKTTLETNSNDDFDDFTIKPKPESEPEPELKKQVPKKRKHKSSSEDSDKNIETKKPKSKKKKEGPSSGSESSEKLEPLKLKPLPEDNRLMFCKLDDDIVKSYVINFNTYNFIERQLLMPGSKCRTGGDNQGRFSVGGVKAFTGYHVAAYIKYGMEYLYAIPQKNKKGKKNEDVLTISHLCGTRNCNHVDHLIIEIKKINDERTHCHFSLNNGLVNIRQKKYKDQKKNIWKAFNELADTICTHRPRCCSLNVSQNLGYLGNVKVK
jgi:hypothetical protein